MAESVTSPTLEPAAQQFADATAKPPFLFDLGPTEGRKVVERCTGISRACREARALRR